MDEICSIMSKILTSHGPLCEHESCIISSLRGLRNGLYYGGKIRFIHSLVMEILFPKGQTLIEKLKNIIKPTFEHATNLGLFVLIYKTLVCVLRRIFNTQNKICNFIAGVIGAYFMWSKRTNVNMQIMLYLLSRNILAITNILSEKYFPNIQNGFSITSIIVWGIVMFLFEWRPKALQNSLKSSMDFIYKDSNSYVDWRDFIPFYIPK